MDRWEKIARKYFDSTVTDRERAIFEGGIALGAICHQFVGVPISPEPRVVRALERAISRCMELQPYKERIRVKINTTVLRRHGRIYHYQTLEEKHLDLTVKSRYRSFEATVRMSYAPELDFPLMYIEKVRRIRESTRRKGIKRRSSS